MRSLSASLAAVVIAACVIAACASSTAPGAHDGDTSSSSASSSTSSSGAPCDPANDLPCGPNEHCLSPSCGGQGTCVPGDDAGHYGPVCGCDGVTYYDDLLALEALVTVRSAGPCDDAAADRCALDGDECATKHGSSSFCSAIVPSGQCLPAPTVGTCWVTPPLCPGTGGTGYGCEDPGNCKAACSIIASQIAWYEAVCEPSGP